MSDFKNRFPDTMTFVAYCDENFDMYPVSWVTGGTAGGNCWDSGGHYSLEAEDEPELTVLDEILLDVMPGLSFMQYRVLTKREVIKVEDDSYHEYYGNHTDRKKKSVDLDKLYNALADLS